MPQVNGSTAGILESTEEMRPNHYSCTLQLVFGPPCGQKIISKQAMGFQEQRGFFRKTQTAVSRPNHTQGISEGNRDRRRLIQPGLCKPSRAISTNFRLLSNCSARLFWLALRFCWA
eukprot:g8240.t1